MCYRIFKWSPSIEGVKEVDALFEISRFKSDLETRQFNGLKLYRNKFRDLKFIAKRNEIEQIVNFLLLHTKKPFWFRFQGKQYLVRKYGAHKIIHRSNKDLDHSELIVSFVEVIKY